MILTDKQLTYLTYAVVIVFAIFPLFAPLPFRIHLDLPWEGAYRLYLGQVPYKDFGMPLGLGFFIMPYFCFLVFGPTLKSLLISQVIVTILSAWVLRKIVLKLNFSVSVAFLVTFIYCLSYTFIYFWPWYNNTAITYQFVSILFLLYAFEKETFKKRFLYYTLAAFFTFLTFFTKQDYGGLALLLNIALVVIYALHSKNYIDVPFFVFEVVQVVFIVIVFLYKTDFSYWFNYGQVPHESRLSLFKILDEIFQNSTWEKFYILVLMIHLYVVFVQNKKWPSLKESLFYLLVLGIVCEALITKTTSGNSTGNTTYYHAFGVLLLLYVSAKYIQLNSLFSILILMSFSFIWFSGDYWKYLNRIFPRSENTKNVLADTSKSEVQHVNWVTCDIPVFSKVKMPEETIQGLKDSKEIYNSMKLVSPNILNMTEVTMLAYDWQYIPQKNSPLWFHVGVGMFQKQIDEFNRNIRSQTYDMVLFEEVPHLDNFFPSACFTELKKNYKLRLKFLAPNKDHDSYIYVFTK